MPIHTTAEVIVDLDLPARYPSRYRGKLVSATRLEARIRFSFEPSVFRSGEIQGCAADLLLRVGKHSLFLQGHFEPDKNPVSGRIRFTEPIGLPDYSFLRRACGLEEREDPESRDETVGTGEQDPSPIAARRS